MDPGGVDPSQNDRFVVTRCRRLTATPSLGRVHTYAFSLPDADEPICNVRQNVSRFDRSVVFHASTAPLMYLAARERFDPWARHEVADASWDTIGAIQKVFVARRGRSHYVLYDRAGDEIALVEPARTRRAAAGELAASRSPARSTSSASRASASRSCTRGLRLARCAGGDT